MVKLWGNVFLFKKPTEEGKQDKLNRIRELVRGMPSNVIFKLDRDLYVGAGGFVVKEGGKVYRIDFERAKEDQWLRKRIDRVSDKTLDMCFEMKEEYRKLRSIMDKDRVERVGALAKELENREFTPDLCTFGEKPGLILDIRRNVYVIKGLPELDPSGAPPLPQKFRNIKELEDFVLKLTEYLNSKTGEKIKTRVVVVDDPMPLLGSYRFDINAIEIKVNPNKVGQIPPSVVAGVLAHEYGHGLVKEYIQLLAKGRVYFYGDDEEENAFMRLINRQSERWADKMGKDITQALYGPNVYRETISYVYQEARKNGFKPINEESTKGVDNFRAYPTFFERKESYPKLK